MYSLIRELTPYLKEVFSKQELSKLKESFEAKQQQLLSILLKETSLSDDAVAIKLYGPKYSKSGYDKVKQRLYYNLIQRLFVPSQSKSLKSFDHFRNKSLKYTAMAKMMIATSCKLNCEHLIREGIKFSKKAGMTENIIELLKIKLNTLGVTKQDRVNFDKVLKEYEFYAELHSRENKLQINFWRLYSRTKANSDRLDIEDDYIASLNSNLIKKESFKLIMYSFFILALHYEALSQYNNLFELASRAIQYTDSLPVEASRLKTYFVRQKYVSALKLKKYTVLQEVFKDYFHQIPKYAPTWYMLKAYDAILLLHTSNFREAMNRLPNAGQYAQGVSENILEFYKLVQGYSKVMVKITAEAGSSKQFRIFSLMNDLPVHSKDKSGMNIAILVLQILFFTDERKYDEIEERVDALKQYSYRYLKKQKSIRSSSYIKMLIEMTKANFHPIRTERYTQDLLKKLESVPLELSEQPLEVEIIPYEQLWEITMELLERNSNIKRGRPKKS